MAQGEPAGFGYWIGVLVTESGLAFREEVPREKRVLFRKLARFLVENEFEHVSELKDGAWQSFFVIWCGGSLLCCLQAQIRVDGSVEALCRLLSWKSCGRWCVVAGPGPQPSLGVSCCGSCSLVVRCVRSKGSGKQNKGNGLH